MRLRGALTATALLATAAALGGPAGAESCGLVRDPADDTRYLDRAETTGVLPQGSVDIVRADVGSNSKELVGVVQVRSLDPATPLERGATLYRIEFTAGTRRLFVQATRPDLSLPTLTAQPRYRNATAGRVGGRAYPVWAEFDTMDDEVRVFAPVRFFGAEGLPLGTVLSQFDVTAMRTYADQGQLAPGVSSRVTVGDTAKSNLRYKAGGPSCVVEEWPEPEPTEPEPSPEPTEPEPSPEPTEPEPTDPMPTDPEPTDPEPTDPEPTDPMPTDPEPTDPEPTEPEPTEPEPTEPEPTEPEPTPSPSVAGLSVT